MIDTASRLSLADLRDATDDTGSYHVQIIHTGTRVDAAFQVEDEARCKHGGAPLLTMCSYW